MTIGDMIREGFHYARTCRSLWVFGFFVGIASGGSGGSNGGGGPSNGGPDGGVGFPFALSITDFPSLLLALVAVIVAIGLVVMFLYFVSEGALIEGVVKLPSASTAGRVLVDDNQCNSSIGSAFARRLLVPHWSSSSVA